MNIKEIEIGLDAPWDVNVIVEVSLGDDPVKYEMDKNSGALYVDRIMHTSMRYPCNYGFIPHTLSEDGDPIDVMVVANVPFIPSSVVRSRPIGVLRMIDESGPDEKILAVPVDKLHPFYSEVSQYSDMPTVLLDQIGHFFEHYKDLEDGKWVKLDGWGDADEAAQFILESVERAKL